MSADRVPFDRVRALAARSKVHAPVLAVFLGLLLLPLAANDALLSILTSVLVAAYFGQAWNLMMGYVGQLSLGHALYAGVGAYAAMLAAGRFGVSPWFGVAAGMAISAAVGAAIAWVGFRFAVRGIHFTLLTIACAELARLGFDHWSFVGGTGGYFLRVAGPGHPILTLRGGTAFYYEAFVVLSGLALALCAALARSRTGQMWRAVREDEDAARAIGVPALRLKVLAVAISGAMTSLGGSFVGLLGGSAFPDNLMGLRSSIEMIVAPIVGGLGTLLGPFAGALFVVPVNEASNRLAQALGTYGLNTLVYGAMLLIVIWRLPDGIGPALGRLLPVRPRLDSVRTAS